MAISDKTRKLIWGRSGNQCAYCRHELVIDARESDVAAVVGDECHIIGPKEGSPRYDPTYPSELLDQCENLVLLCRVHHKMVDDQPVEYNVDALRTLKTQHERRVRAALRAEPLSSDRDKFDKECGDFPKNATEEKIQTRGHWWITVRPVDYEERRVDNILNLVPLVQKLSVQLQVWDFPYTDVNQRPQIDGSWVGQSIEWENFLESWQIYKSGQFTFLGAFLYDWPSTRFTYSEPQGSPVLLVEDALRRYVGIFEFAARLARSPVGSQQMFVRVGAHNLSDRFLVNEPMNPFGFRFPKIADLKEFLQEREFEREELAGDAERIALSWATELFRRFNWDPEPGILEGICRKFRPTVRTS
jgi:hypothetical protein